MVKGAIFRIPVEELTRVFFMNKYKDLLIENRFIEFKGGSSSNIFARIISFAIKEKMKKNHLSHKDNFDGPILEICLPNYFMKYGLEKDSAIEVGRLFDKMAKHELNLLSLALSSMPEFSTSVSIRIVLSVYGITEDNFDSSHFRRYYDRYVQVYSGYEFKEYSYKFNKFLREWVENNPKLVKKLPSCPE